MSAHGKGKHTVVVANGELPHDAGKQLTQLLLDADQLIAVDGGLRHCVELNVWPTTLIGDLDSAPTVLIDQARQHDVTIHAFPVDKDATDLELALELAGESAATQITIVAAFGGRLDHELATISLLASTRWRAMSITATDGNREVHVVHEQRSFGLGVGTTVSLVPWHGDAGGVTTQGLQWPLNNDMLAAGTTRGVSNITVESTQLVTVRTGVLLVVVDPSET